MCTVLLPPGDNPIAVNKYVIYIIQGSREEASITYDFVPQIRPWLRHSTSSWNHYSLISLPSDTVQGWQLTVLWRSH